VHVAHRNEPCKGSAEHRCHTPAQPFQGCLQSLDAYPGLPTKVGNPGLRCITLSAYAASRAIGFAVPIWCCRIAGMDDDGRRGPHQTDRLTMFHYLHVGFLDPEGVAHREVRVVGAFPPDALRALLSKHGDVALDGTVSFLGEDVQAKEGFVVCPWMI